VKGLGKGASSTSTSEPPQGRDAVSQAHLKRDASLGAKVIDREPCDTAEGGGCAEEIARDRHRQTQDAKWRVRRRSGGEEIVVCQE
jgi:hypothetical protein